MLVLKLVWSGVFTTIMTQIFAVRSQLASSSKLPLVVVLLRPRGSTLGLEGGRACSGVDGRRHGALALDVQAEVHERPSI